MAIRVTGVREIERELEGTLAQTLKAVSETVYTEAQSATPVDTGYTRRQWRKSTSKDNFTVQNTVPWINQLERGSSRQAPRGIIGPTLKNSRRK